MKKRTLRRLKRALKKRSQPSTRQKQRARWRSVASESYLSASPS